MAAELIIDAEAHLLHPPAQHADFAQGTDEPARAAIHEHEDFPLLAGRLAVEGLLSSMTENGIGHAVVMGLSWRDKGILRDNNAYIAECVKNHGDRFRGLYIADPTDPAEAAREIAALDKSVFLGAKLIPSWQGVRMDDLALAPMFDVLEERDMFLMVHVDHMTQSLDGDTPFRLLRLLRRRPNLKVLATHLGGLLCLYGLLPEFRDDLRNAYFVTSVSATMAMVAFAARVNPHNLIFGTDFPFNHSHDQQTPLEALRALNLPDVERRGILGENARGLFGWG